MTTTTIIRGIVPPRKQRLPTLRQTPLTLHLLFKKCSTVSNNMHPFLPSFLPFILLSSHPIPIPITHTSSKPTNRTPLPQHKEPKAFRRYVRYLANNVPQAPPEVVGDAFRKWEYRHLRTCVCLFYFILLLLLLLLLLRCLFLRSPAQPSPALFLLLIPLSPAQRTHMYKRLHRKKEHAN